MIPDHCLSVYFVYHGYFELVLESLGKHLIAADIIVFEII